MQKNSNNCKKWGLSLDGAVPKKSFSSESICPEAESEYQHRIQDGRDLKSGQVCAADPDKSRVCHGGVDEHLERREKADLRKNPEFGRDRQKQICQHRKTDHSAGCDHVIQHPREQNCGGSDQQTREEKQPRIDQQQFPRSIGIR